MKELDSLLLFAKVVELKSFAEAARQLHLPTTTVSRKIQQLEQQLGGKLLNRTTRALSLTELGERVLPKALLIDDAVKELKTEAEEFSSQSVGRLHISAPRAFCQTVLAPLLARFRLLYPGIAIELDASNRIEDLTKSRVDFAFRVGQLQDSSLIALPLSQVDFELVGASGNDYNDLTHPQQLTQYPSIRNHVDGFILPWQFSRDGKSFLHQGEADMLSDDLHVSIAYAVAGVGLSYLPVAFVKPFIESQQLQVLLSDFQKSSQMAHLIYPNRSYLPQKSKLFIAFIRDNLAYFSQLLAR